MIWILGCHNYIGFLVCRKNIILSTLLKKEITIHKVNLNKLDKGKIQVFLNGQFETKKLMDYLF